MIKGLIVGVSFLAMASVAQAEPVALTAKQMDGITAGNLPSLPSINVALNVAVTTQVALPIAIGIGSSASAIGSNLAFTSQEVAGQ